METSEQASAEVQSARMPLRQMNFHDDALAVIASLNRVSVWRHGEQIGGTPVRVAHVHTKYADTRYL